MAINRIFGAIRQTGNVSGSLDNISSSLIREDDLAVVKDDNLDSINFYRYDSTSGEVDNYPTIIAPDDAVIGRWKLISPRYFIEDLVVDPDSSIIVNEIYGNDTGLRLGYSETGSVISINLVNAGTGLTDGVYTNEPTTDGSGSGLTVDITVSGGSITVMSINSPGTGYKKDDTFTIDNFSPASGSIAWVDSIAVSIEGTLVTFHKDTRFVKNVSFERPSASGAPFTVNGNNVLVDDLNVELHDGEPISNISLLDDNTNKYSVIPQVTNATTVYPSVDSDFVTVKYYEDEINSGIVDHGSLTGLGDDDHLQYIRTTGDRLGVGFSATISGVYPVLSQHLTTKQYVDDEIDGLGLGSGGAYLLRDGSLTALDVLVYDSSVTTAVLDSSSGFSISSTDFVNFRISTHVSQTDPHTQYLRNDGDDSTTGRLSSTILTSNAQGNYITRSELDGLLGDVYANLSTSDSYTGIGVPIVQSNIVRRDNPKATIDYIATDVESLSENLPTYGYLDVRLCNLLQSSNLIVRGEVIEVQITNAGTGYSTGVVSPTGGSGAGLQIEIISVAAGVITGVKVNQKGTNYVQGETVNIPGGTGGVLTLNEVTHGASHSDLYDLDSDDHLQYMNLDCSRPLDNTVNFPSVSDQFVLPSQPTHLITKAYLDTAVGSTDAILKDGSVVLTGNQQYQPPFPHYYFTSNADNKNDYYDLINKGYVDTYLGKILTSDEDGIFGYLEDSFVETGDTYTILNVVNDGSDTGIQIEDVHVNVGVISSYEITNKGSGFVIIDSGDLNFPQSRGTGTTTNFPVFDSTGTNTTFSELSFNLTESGNSSADVRPSKVYGDVGFIEIQNGGSGYNLTDTILVRGNGSGATWQITSIGGSGEITGVQRLSPASNGYTNDDVSLFINTPSGTGAVLVPYIQGGIIDYRIQDGGTGYIAEEFVYNNVQNDGFAWYGTGTTSTAIDDANFYITLGNYPDGRMLIDHYNDGVLEGNVGVSPFTVPVNHTISTISFDDYGHITDITTVDNSVDGGVY